MRMLKQYLFPLALQVLIFQTANAETDWMSVTFDNDIFVGNDSGYTNGMFVSWYDVGITTSEDKKDRFTKPGFLVRPLLWTLPAADDRERAMVNAYTIGQVMVTPQDISIQNPALDELPYSGLLFFNDTYLVVNEKYADSISTTLGVVGPLSGAESTQKWVHELLGADDPQGWNSQLDNELVFRFSRGRIWRSWISKGDHFDILLESEAGLGTISSYVLGGVIFRFGNDLTTSAYATQLFSTTKTSNPASIDGGWYTYAGITYSYLFNQIFTDGNTFKESRSIDYSHDRIGLAAGLAYSWTNVSLTIAINDYSAYEDKVEKDQLGELTRYGTLTVAWRY